jgi:hypothetical protein
VQSEEITRLSPQARHFSLQGGGHLFPMQAPDWAASHLRIFLSSFP